MLKITGRTDHIGGYPVPDYPVERLKLNGYPKPESFLDILEWVSAVDRFHEEKLQSLPKETAYVMVTPPTAHRIPDEMDILVSHGAKAIVLQVYATGTAPDSIVPKVRELREKGVPVLLLADCAGDEYGILRLTYSPNHNMAEAGAIHIETCNTRHFPAVIVKINEIIAGATDYDDLVKRLKEVFWFTPEEAEEIETRYLADPEKTVTKEGEITRTRELCRRLGLAT